jgi:hypothetical protein
MHTTIIEEEEMNYPYTPTRHTPTPLPTILTHTLLDYTRTPLRFYWVFSVVFRGLGACARLTNESAILSLTFV